MFSQRNNPYCDYNQFKAEALFIRSKIQFFESKSQRKSNCSLSKFGCLSDQRYNFLKANHNTASATLSPFLVVYQIKDTIFWKQITTILINRVAHTLLFIRSKIQFFESKSQRYLIMAGVFSSCLSDQRYNFLKANHNSKTKTLNNPKVVYQIKDTIFWKQINLRSSHIHYPACFYILWFEIYWNLNICCIFYEFLIEI